MEMGPKPGVCKINAESFKPVFAGIVKETGSVQAKSAAATGDS